MRTLVLLLMLTGVARAQPASGSAPVSDLDMAVRRGGLATMAELCGLRSQSWSEDLRRAAIQDATRTPTPDDPALQSAPGSDLVVGAIGYGDLEATEAFASATQSVLCAKLARDPDMADADLRVAAVRNALRRAQRLW